LKGEELGNRGSGIYSTKMVVFEERRWADIHIIVGFAGTTWSCRFIMRHGM
jgi:hypothetical protein